jgi:hypothetical protein
MASIDDVIRLLEAANNSEKEASAVLDPQPKTKKAKRQPSAYQKRYSKAFKKHQNKYKTTKGKWKKDGFKRCQKAAHKEAKK